LLYLYIYNSAWWEQRMIMSVAPSCFIEGVLVERSAKDVWICSMQQKGIE
jgi:hypothetical protein